MNVYVYAHVHVCVHGVHVCTGQRTTSGVILRHAAHLL